MADTNDAKVTTLEFPQFSPTQVGCTAHPNIAAQATMVNRLAARITELTGRTAAPTP